MRIKETELTNLAQDWDKWQDRVNTVMNVRVSKMWRIS
jgi:hypothetical protein